MTHNRDEQKLEHYLQQTSQHFIDTMNNFDNYLEIRDAHFAYSNLCMSYSVPSNRSLIMKIPRFNDKEN